MKESKVTTMLGLRFLRRRLESRSQASAEALHVVDDWIERRRAERLREEAMFESPARNGALIPISQAELTDNQSLRRGSTEEDSVRQAIRSFARLVEFTQVAVPTTANHLLALREVAFHADKFSAEISHDIDEQLADSDPSEGLVRRIFRWLRNPVGTGFPAQVDRLSPQRIYPLTAVLRMVGAIAASVFFVWGSPWIGVTLLLGSVITSGLLRFLTNAETAVTLRARYLSCMLGNLGDILVLLSLTLYLSDVAGKALVIGGVLTTVVMVFGSLMRTGALSAGVHVSRIRMERVVRVGGIALGASLAAAGHPNGLVITFSLIGLWSILEVVRVVRRIVVSTTTHFAWVATSGVEGSFSGGLVTTTTGGDENAGAAPDPLS